MDTAEEEDQASEDKENDPDGTPQFLRVLRAKDESAQTLQRCLEAERRRRRQERVEALSERQALEERAQQVESELQQRLQALEVENEQQRNDLSSVTLRLASQSELSRGREASLLEKNEILASDLRRLLLRAEADSADLLSLRAQLDSSAAELEEMQRVIKISDDVRTGLYVRSKSRPQHWSLSGLNLGKCTLWRDQRGNTSKLSIRD